MATETIDTEIGNIVLTTSSTAEDINAADDYEGVVLSEALEKEMPLPVFSKESRHSIGTYNAPTKIIVEASNSLGVYRKENHRQSENILAKSKSEIQVGGAKSLSVSQNSKQSSITLSSSGTFYGHGRKNVDIKLPSKAPQPNTAKDITDFRQMEKGLLQLLDDFHSGKLEAFGQNCTFEKMESVREQQEKLARLHFDLNAQQEMSGQHTDEGIKVAKGNLSKLVENLQILSNSIEQLQSGSVGTEDDK